MSVNRWMRRCVHLAGQGRGRTAPNPMVGAVIIKDDQLVAEGWSTADIANELGVSVKTVETHRQNTMKKLETDSIAELTKLALREGVT